MKFGSTWLKTALLGSAMLVMSGVFAQGTPAEGKKLTETFDEGITATYSPEIADKTKVAAGEYTVTFTVVKDKELGDVTFNGDKLSPVAAEKPLEFKFTMPSDKDGVLVAKVKASTPAEGKKLTETFDEGITATYSPEIADKTKVAAGEYTVTFTVVKGKELGDVTFNGEKLTATAEKPLEFKFTMPADKDSELVAKLKGETPANAVPLTAEFNADGGNVYLVGIKLNEKGEPAEFNFEEEYQFPFNAVKGTWYGVIAQWKEGYMIDKFQRVLVTEGKDVVFDLIAQKKVEKLTSKEGKLLAYGALIAFGSATKVTSGKFVANFKKATAVEDNAFAAVNVYPNPFAGKLVVNEVAEASRVTLVNAQGVVLRSVAVNGANQVELDVTDVPAGIYMVVVENGAARRAFKVVK